MADNIMVSIHTPLLRISYQPVYHGSAGFPAQRALTREQLIEQLGLLFQLLRNAVFPGQHHPREECGRTAGTSHCR